MKFLLPLSLMLILASCDHHHTYEYHLDNNHDDTLILDYYNEGFAKTDTFPPGTSIMFHTATVVGGRKAKGDERTADQLSLDAITSSSTTEMLTESYWNYTNEGKYINIYTFVVDETIVE